MIHVTKFYEMDPDQIVALARENENAGEYRFILKICTKTNHTFMVRFDTEAGREETIRTIVADIKRAKERNRLTAAEIRSAAAAEIDKLRPYLRRIEKLLTGTSNQNQTKKKTEETP